MVSLIANRKAARSSCKIHAAKLEPSGPFRHGLSETSIQGPLRASITRTHEPAERTQFCAQSLSNWILPRPNFVPLDHRRSLWLSCLSGFVVGRERHRRSFVSDQNHPGLALIPVQPFWGMGTVRKANVVA